MAGYTLVLRGDKIVGCIPTNRGETVCVPKQDGVHSRLQQNVFTLETGAMGVHAIHGVDGNDPIADTIRKGHDVTVGEFPHQTIFIYHDGAMKVGTDLKKHAEPVVAEVYGGDALW